MSRLLECQKPRGLACLCTRCGCAIQTVCINQARWQPQHVQSGVLMCCVREGRTSLCVQASLQDNNSTCRRSRTPRACACVTCTCCTWRMTLRTPCILVRLHPAHSVLPAVQTTALLVMCWPEQRRAKLGPAYNGHQQHNRRACMGTCGWCLQAPAELA